MIDNQLIQMLDDPNPKVRADAVKQLAKTKSQEAVQYLAAVYKTDNDPEIRELARKAGLYIKKKMTEEKWTGGDEEDDEEEELPQKPKMLEVSARNLESAKGYMETAMNLHVAGEDDKAIKMLEKAFKANPNLRFDNYSVGLASTIMEVSGDEAVSILIGEDELRDTGGDKPKRKRAESDPNEVTMEMVAIDLLIFWIVMAAILIVGTLIQFQIISSVINDMSALAASSGSSADAAMQQQIIEQTMSVLYGAGLVGSIIYAAIVSLFYVFGLLILYAILHFIAGTMFAGEGTFKGLIHRLTNFITFYWAGLTIVTLIFTVRAFSTMFENSESMIQSINSFNTLSGLMLLAMIFFVLWISKLTGENYQFGGFRGCLSVFLTMVTVIGLSCGCIFAFSSSIASSLVPPT